MKSSAPQDSRFKEVTSKILQLRIVLCQIVGFVALVAWCWIDELFDLPARLFGAPASPANVVEAIEETVVIGFIGFLIVITTVKLLNRLKVLEGVAPTCAFCKKIRVKDEWYDMEEYFAKRSDLEFSHGFCPVCAEKHYGYKK